MNLNLQNLKTNNLKCSAFSLSQRHLGFGYEVTPIIASAEGEFQYQWPIGDVSIPK